jgi:hypothetical protein
MQEDGLHREYSGNDAGPSAEWIMHYDVRGICAYLFQYLWQYLTTFLRLLRLFGGEARR